MPPAPMCIARVIGHPLATSAVLRLPPSKATAPCPSCSPITDASSSIGSGLFSFACYHINPQSIQELLLQ
ncbi:hypothetical protein DAI22_09g036400 [Oryza sativa Japonica Group]|nr:hypothetical protein DAI22_09g036400 [Oryza sativa Japonica Group]